MLAIHTIGAIDAIRGDMDTIHAVDHLGDEGRTESLALEQFPSAPDAFAETFEDGNSLFPGYARVWNEA